MEYWKRKELVSKVTKIAIVGTIVWFVLFLIYAAYIDIQTDKDIDGYMHKAEVSADADDMLAFLKCAEQGMDKWGYIDGHRAIFIHTPENDVAIERKILSNLIHRVELASGMDEECVEYYTAMIDLRQTLGEFHWYVGDYYFLHDHPILTLFSTWIIWILFVVAGVVNIWNWD